MKHLAIQYSIYLIVAATFLGLGFCLVKIANIKEKRRRGMLLALMVAGSIVITRFFILPEYYWAKSKKQFLESNPVFVAFKKVDPNEYKKLTSQAKMLFRRYLTRPQTLREEARDLFSETTQKLYKKYGPSSSDEAILSAAKITFKGMQKLATINSDLCFAYFFPDNSETPDITHYLDPTDREILYTEWNRSILEGINELQPRPDPQKVKETEQTIIMQLIQEHGVEDFNALEKLIKNDKKKSCDMMISFHAKILALPEKESSAFFRDMLQQ